MLGLIIVKMFCDTFFEWIFENLELHSHPYIGYVLYILNIHFPTLSAVINEIARAEDTEEKWENNSGDLINCTMRYLRGIIDAVRGRLSSLIISLS